MSELHQAVLSHQEAFYRSLVQVTETGAALLQFVVPNEEIDAFLGEARAAKLLPDSNDRDAEIPISLVAVTMPTTQYLETLYSEAFGDNRMKHFYSVRLRNPTGHWHNDNIRDYDGRGSGIRGIVPLTGALGTVEYLPKEGEPSRKLHHAVGDLLLMAESPAEPLQFRRDGIDGIRKHPRHTGYAATERFILVHEVSPSVPLLDIDTMLARL